MAKNLRDCTPEEIEERKRLAWAYLNKHGIYTMEEFEEAYRKVPKIDMSIFAPPIKSESNINPDDTEN